MMFSLFIIIFNLPLRCSTRIDYLSINENDFAPRHLLTLNFPHPPTSLTIITPNLQDYFSMKNQSELYALQSFDREDFCERNICSCSIPCSIQLKILARPEHQISLINITINDLNDNLHHFPFEQIQLLIPENTNHRQCYRLPSVNDDDLWLTNQFHYRLVGNDSHRFHINQTSENNLCLTIRNSFLDREECERYDHLWIIAEDEQNQQAIMKILIHVLDMNDNSPRFATNDTTLYINETFVGPLICIPADDPDEGNNARIMYSFDGMERKLLDYFHLNDQTACITILQPLLLTFFDKHLFIRIRAQDFGSKLSSTLPTYHLLQLVIEDMNDYQPIIEVKQIIAGIETLQNNSKISVQENTVGDIAIISVSDRDSGIYGEVQLKLIVQSEYEIHRDAFRIKSNSQKHYKLKLINPLDYELESSFNLYLEAVDAGRECTRFELTIFIENQNDQQPRFEQDHYYFTVNIQPPSSIFHPIQIARIHAVDDDSPSESLIYSFTSNYFQIHPHTGEITLTRPLSMNMTDQMLTFIGHVTDGELMTNTNITIFIHDYNHPPQLEKEEYYFEIDENLPIRTLVGQINAKDKDSPFTPRGILTYSLRPITSYSEFFFHITLSGQILLTNIPDAEQEQLHEFLLIVKDHGTPPLLDQAKLRIKINDINEHCPKLVNHSSESYLFISREEYSSQIFTYQLSAFDDDVSDQSNIKFHLFPSASSHLFDLHDNGLFILKEFPLEIPSIIKLRYSLSDHFFPQACITEEKLILFIGQTCNDCHYLLDQFQKARFISQEIDQPKIHFVVLIFTSFVLIIFIALLYLTLTFSRHRRERQRSITTKSLHIINPSLLFDNHHTH